MSLHRANASDCTEVQDSVASVVLVLVLVIVIEDIENTTMYQHMKSIEKRERLFDGACVMFFVDYEHDA